jgi:lipopolysaccharide transport system ATP-binding protein
MPIIEVSHVTKEFQLGQLTTLRHSVLRGTARLMGKTVPPRPRFLALKDVHFRVEPGEVLGIIGTNGAGKSTLLKLLAGVTVPTSGSVLVRGTTAPLIEVGAGLISDLTGRENVYLNGIILGMSYRQIKRKLDEIVAFAELEEFLDTPIKRYSSGMQIRLGFSIATAVPADVLIVDEVLAVGDLAFQRKCFDRIEEMIKEQGRTILLVSHNVRQVERLCTRALLLDHGTIIADDTPVRVCEQFYERSDEKIRLSSTATHASPRHAHSNDEFELQDLSLVDSAGNSQDRIAYQQPLTVRIRFLLKRELSRPNFVVGVHTTDFLYLSTHSSLNDVDLPKLAAGAYEMTFRVKNNPLLPGVYGLRLSASDGTTERGIFTAENLAHFQVIYGRDEATSRHTESGFFSLGGSWSSPRQCAVDGEAAERVTTI